jgi:type IV secretory pathway TrbD component
MIDLFVLAKGLAAWLVPLAVVAYVALYFVMATIAVIVWKNGRDPRIRQVWRKFARLNLPGR